MNQIYKQDTIDLALQHNTISPSQAVILTGIGGYNDFSKALRTQININLAKSYINVINLSATMSALIYNLDVIKLRQITNPDYIVYLCNIQNDAQTREIVLDHLISGDETLEYLAKEIMGLNE